MRGLCWALVDIGMKGFVAERILLWWNKRIFVDKSIIRSLTYTSHLWAMLPILFIYYLTIRGAWRTNHKKLRHNEHRPTRIKSITCWIETHRAHSEVTRGRHIYAWERLAVRPEFSPLSFREMHAYRNRGRYWENGKVDFLFITAMRLCYVTLYAYLSHWQCAKSA